MKPGGVKRWFRFPSRTRDDIRADVDDEIQFQIDMRTEDLRRSGMSERDARVQAGREFGDRATATRTSVRREKRIERRRYVARIFSEFWQDAVVGIRLIRRNPGFAAAVIATVAVTTAGHTAIFSVVNSLLFKPLPLATAAHELARVRGGASQMSWPDYRDVLARQRVFRELVAHRRLVVGFATTGAPARLWGEQVSLNYFRALGVSPDLGRTFTPADTRRDVVILAAHLWHARFGGDPSVLGRVLMLNGRPFEVLGVMPAGFRGAAPPGPRNDFWAPVNETVSDQLLSDRAAARFEVFGRLNPAVSRAQAAAALRVIAQQIRAEHPTIRDTFANMEVLPVDGLGAFRGMANLILPVLAFLALMTVVAGLLLLIGCANISGLLLGRAAARSKEIAVRLAVGAGRARLVRQLLTESLVLALAGGAGGTLLALWLTGGVNSLFSRLPVPIEFDLALDRRVLAYTLGLSTLTALVFGLLPARRAASVDLVSSLKDDAAGRAGRQKLRRALVVGQVAVCSMLLVWSGLFVRSLYHVGGIDPGFDPEGVLLARIEFDEGTHAADFGRRFARDFQQAVERSPGVDAAGGATVVPLSIDNEEFDLFRVVDRPGTQPFRQRVFANRLTPGWFDTVKIPFVAGRDFRWSDGDWAPGVAIVNETLARQFWNGGAVGRRVLGPEKRVLEIVGVVRDSKYWTLGEEIRPTIYLPFQQAYLRSMTLHIRADVRSATNAITRASRSLAPDVFVDVAPMKATTGLSVLPAQVGAAVSAAFGGLAMLLAALGVYGLVAFSVSQRTREIAVRRAIGASTFDIMRLVIGEHGTLTLIGLAAGVGLGGVGANVFRSFIAGVSPADAMTFAVVATVVASAALVASALPALHAALVSPMLGLRDS